MFEGINLITILTSSDSLIASVLTEVSAVFIGILLLWTVVAKLANSITGFIKVIEDEKKIREKYSNHDYVPDIHKNTRLNKDLAIMREKVGADRVLLLQVHNGERSIAKNPFLKYSCTHEALSVDADSIMGKIRDAQMSMCNHWANKLVDNEVITCESVACLKNDLGMKALHQYIESFAVKSLYVFPLRDRYGVVYGMGVVHFNTTEVKLTEKTKAWLKSQFAITAILLAHGEHDDDRKETN